MFEKNIDREAFKKLYSDGNWGIINSATEEMRNAFSAFGKAFNEKSANAEALYAETLSKASTVTNMMTVISVSIDPEDDIHVGQFVDVATYVATTFDAIIDAIPINDIKAPFEQDRNAVVETVRPIILHFIDKALMLYRIVPNLMDIGLNISIDMQGLPQEYKNTPELVKSLQKTRNYWAA